MNNLKFEFEGTTYNVPCMPEKKWGFWMTDTWHGCRLPGNLRELYCGGRICSLTQQKACIFAFRKGYANTEARKAFYYQYFPEEAPKEKPSCENCKNYSPEEEPKKELPKLTKEVFNRKECPKWANWAAVDADGKAFWYRYRPRPLEAGSLEWFCSAAEDFGGYVRIEQSFDASDWEHSLIERDKTILCSTVSWPTWFKYSKTAGKYYVMRSAEKYFIVGTVLAVEEVPYDVVDVNPFFKYPAALVGEKVRALWSENHEVSMVIAASNRGVTLGGELEERSIGSFIMSFASCADIPLCSFKEVK